MLKKQVFISLLGGKMATAKWIKNSCLYELISIMIEDLLKQFPHISANNFAILFSSNYYKMKRQFPENVISFVKLLFSSPREPGFCISRFCFSSLDIMNILYITQACMSA